MSTSPQEHHLPTVRTGRFYTQGAELQDVQRVWIVLHGYAQLAVRQLRHFEGIIPADTLLVVPEALSRFYLELPRADGGHMARVGAAWMTREDREAEINDANGWLDTVAREVMDSVARASGRAPQVSVLAFSQGVATCMRWLARSAMQPTQAVFWAGGVAADADSDGLRAALSHTKVTLVAGTEDQFLSETNRARLAAAWAALGIPVVELAYEGGHELSRAVLAELLQ